jgi:hypothetical protein
VGLPSAAASTTAGKDELSGDLYAKQGDHKRAVESYEAAYKAAIARLQDLHKAGMQGSDPLVVSGQKTVAAMLAKLLQAQVAAGDLDAARETLKKLEPYQNLSRSTPATTTAKTTLVRRLPHLLEITATKRDLDAADGKADSLDAFRQKATVREFDPDAARLERLRRAEETAVADSSVTGVVLQVDLDRKLVEISVGHDDGVKVGQRGRVVRDKQVGGLELVLVQPDRSVARIISGEPRNGDAVHLEPPKPAEDEGKAGEGETNDADEASGVLPRGSGPR